MEMTLTRAKFDELTRDLVERTRGPVQQALSDAGITAADLGMVLLVGGSTRMPSVYEEVTRITGRDKDIFMMIPLVEGCPVVPTYQQRKLDVCEFLADGLKRVPGIGWLGQAKLVVACLELRLLLQCLLHHFQSQMVIEQVGCRLFKGVHRRYHKPHLVQPRLLAQAFRQCDMAGMDGVEATAKDSYFLTLNFEHRTLNIEL